MTRNPNILRVIKLIDSGEIQSVRDVPDPHGSQDIEKSEIRTHNLMRTYLGENCFFKILRPVGIQASAHRWGFLATEKIHDGDGISDL